MFNDFMCVDSVHQVNVGGGSGFHSQFQNCLIKLKTLNCVPTAAMSDMCDINSMSRGNAWVQLCATLFTLPDKGHTII